MKCELKKEKHIHEKQCFLMIMNTQDFDICISGDVIDKRDPMVSNLHITRNYSVEKKPMYDERTSLVN